MIQTRPSRITFIVDFIIEGLEHISAMTCGATSNLLVFCPGLFGLPSLYEPVIVKNVLNEMMTGSHLALQNHTYLYPCSYIPLSLQYCEH